jgi:leucyl aminopeptidase
MDTSTLFKIEKKHERNAVCEADAIVVLLGKDDLERSEWIHPQLDRSIAAIIDRKLFAGEKNDIHMIPTHGLVSPAFVMIAGSGSGSAERNSAEFVHTLREIGVQIAKTALKYSIETLCVELPLQAGAEADAAEKAAYALTEGILLGSYRAKSYHRDRKEAAVLRQVAYRSPDSASHTEAMRRGIAIAEAYAAGTNYARDLTNLPGNYLVPATMAEEAVKLSVKYGLGCQILDENDIQALGMGGLYEVGKGSAHPPRMIVLKYQGLPEWTDVLGLVGKGITFDTGGISLKEAKGMEEMVSDMGGAAVVLGVIRAAAEMGLKANVLAIIPAAENMPSGAAFKPGDIVTTMSGRTVEVLNTDAEGRIVLADGVTYAKKLGATRLIDVATLTGAVLVALADVATGAITNDERFLATLVEASHNVGERVWQLPAYPEFKEMLKSEVADLNNSPGKWGASITAGLFVGMFAEDTPWIHLDTGGTAWLWKERGVDPKGGTGAMVRTIMEMIRAEEAEA